MTPRTAGEKPLFSTCFCASNTVETQGIRGKSGWSGYNQSHDALDVSCFGAAGGFNIEINQSDEAVDQGSRHIDVLNSVKGDRAEVFCNDPAFDQEISLMDRITESEVADQRGYDHEKTNTASNQFKSRVFIESSAEHLKDGKDDDDRQAANCTRQFDHHGEGVNFVIDRLTHLACPLGSGTWVAGWAGFRTETRMVAGLILMVNLGMKCGLVLLEVHRAMIEPYRVRLGRVFCEGLHRDVR